MQQLEDLAMPLLQCASTRGKRHAANALAQLEDAPRRLILALADEPVEISAPILLRSPFCVLPTSSKSSAGAVLPMRAPLRGASPVTFFCKVFCAVSPIRSSTARWRFRKTLPISRQSRSKGPIFLIFLQPAHR